jgi:hypothetical protein
VPELDEAAAEEHRQQSRDAGENPDHGVSQGARRDEMN